MQPSLAGLSALKQKIDVTPKVTLTKTTIVKSSPFLISRHHLDDTQMYSSLKLGNKLLGTKKVSRPIVSLVPIAIKEKE